MEIKQYKYNIKENKFNSKAENINAAFWKDTQSTSYLFKQVPKKSAYICIIQWMKNTIDQTCHLTDIL